MRIGEVVTKRLQWASDQITEQELNLMLRQHTSLVSQSNKMLKDREQEKNQNNRRGTSKEISKGGETYISIPISRS